MLVTGKIFKSRLRKKKLDKILDSHVNKILILCFQLLIFKCKSNLKIGISTDTKTVCSVSEDIYIHKLVMTRKFEIFKIIRTKSSKMGT